jgi:hypothetical protein
MAKKAKPNNLLQKPVPNLISLFAILGLILIFIVLAINKYSAFYSAFKIPTQSISYVPVVTDTPDLTLSLTPMPTWVPIVKTFTSNDLGISFDYVEPYNQPIHITEVGNKVYLNVRQDEPPLGKYVEVFLKNSTDSLSEAVRKQFLQGYSIQNCPVVPANLEKSYFENSTYQYIQITIPLANSYQEGMQLEQKCPPTYTYNRRSGIVYFMMDTSHSGKFVFFNLGQDNFLGKPTPSNDTTTTWDRTIKVLQ